MSADDPIIIKGAEGHFNAVAAEYQYIAMKYGTRQKDWELLGQALINHKGRMIDEMRIRLSNGKLVILYFDITEYFGLD